MFKTLASHNHINRQGVDMKWQGTQILINVQLSNMYGFRLPIRARTKFFLAKAEFLTTNGQKSFQKMDASHNHSSKSLNESPL